MVGMQAGAAAVETSMEFPENIKSRATPVTKQFHVRVDVRTPTFIAALPTAAMVWKPPGVRGPHAEGVAQRRRTESYLRSVTDLNKCHVISLTCGV